MVPHLVKHALLEHSHQNLHHQIVLHALQVLFHLLVRKYVYYALLEHTPRKVPQNVLTVRKDISLQRVLLLVKCAQLVLSHILVQPHVLNAEEELIQERVLKHVVYALLDLILMKVPLCAQNVPPVFTLLVVLRFAVNVKLDIIQPKVQMYVQNVQKEQLQNLEHPHVSNYNLIYCLLFHLLIYLFVS